MTAIALESLHNPITKGAVEQEIPLIHTAIREPNEYFGEKRRNFNFPKDPKETGFQKKERLGGTEEEPFWEPRTYKQVAETIGCMKGFRCRRGIGSSGQLTGYAGSVHLKEKLHKTERLLKAGD